MKPVNDEVKRVPLVWFLDVRQIEIWQWVYWDVGGSMFIRLRNLVANQVEELRRR